MNCKQANNLSLHKVLINLGISCTKDNTKEAWFLSPFRNETKASLKVDKILNLFYNHGLGVGGRVIDFIMILKNCNTKEALKILRGTTESNIFSFQQQKPSEKKLIKNYKIISEQRIRKAALISYLHKRKIDVSIAKKYCVELHYSVNNIKAQSDNIIKPLNNNAIKTYYAIAFKNDLGGYETRNSIFKSCLIAKAISTIDNNSKTLNLFEGFSDFLSYLTLMPQNENENFIITNSTAITKNTIELLPNYDMVKTFFDNDISGIKATKLIEQNCKSKFFDESRKFKNYNDVNEYLLGLKR